MYGWWQDHYMKVVNVILWSAVAVIALRDYKKE